MDFTLPIPELIERRFSTRTYVKQMIEPHKYRLLADYAAVQTIGPLGTRSRFDVIAATEGDSKALRGLGTYGFIKGAAGFIVGATVDQDHALEDFGYLMERIILYATELDLGTCWLGGSFNRSRFAKKISTRPDEIIPAVTSVGYIAPNPRKIDAYIRQEARSDQRRPWDWLFFDGEFGKPLSEVAAGEYAVPLEMVRLGPSASNCQPWRIVKAADAWHFYLQRTPGYRDSTSARLLKTADLQRVDLGIALCHFELTANYLGLPGCWDTTDPGIPIPDDLIEYTASWIP